MKLRIIRRCIILTILLTTLLSGCKKNNDSIYGIYQYDSLVFLSPLSSSSVGYMNAQMKETKFYIEMDRFQITSNEDNYEIIHPTYEKRKLTKAMIKELHTSVLERSPFLNYRKRYQYAIYSNENEKINYYIFRMDDEVWVARYSSNTLDKSDVIMSIYKLKK